MHLTVVCPACQSQYQVDTNLRGKRMRCPNTICRAVFEVTDPSPPAREPAPEPPRKPAPVAKPAAPPPEKVAAPIALAAPDIAPAAITPPAPQWSAPPPVRSAAVRATPAAPIDDMDFPGDFPDDDPVTPSSVATATVSPEPSVPLPAPPLSATPFPAVKRRRSLLFVGVAVVMLAAAGAFVVQRIDANAREREQLIVAQADDAYAQDDFPRAKDLYQRLQRDYPTSKNLPRYRIRAVLSELRGEADAADDPDALNEAREHVLAFLTSSGNSQELKEHREDIDHLTRRMTHRLVKRAEETLDPAKIAHAEEMAKWTPDGVAAHAKTFAAIRARIAETTRRQQFINDLKRLAEFPSAVAIADVSTRLAAAGLADDPELKGLLAAGKKSLQDSVVRKPPEPALKDTFVDNSGCTTFLALPIRPVTPARGDEPVVALTPTGVLYALKPRTGEFAWATRLGIDSRIAPRRVDGGWLVISNDARTIALLDPATGKRKWTTVLTAAAAGEPTLAPGHLLVPLVTGRLDDLNPDTGASQGFYVFDQPLPHGGTPHPGTSLVSLPGREACMYVIDVAAGTCAAVVETGHAAGSLVGAPLSIADESRKDEPRGWIVLTLAEPGPRIRLRPIPYPADGRAAADVTIPGTLSGPPYHDAESILLATQEGRLRSVGRKLPGTSDPLLFPLTPADVALESPPAGMPMQAQVVHVDADTLWVLSAGRLQRLNKLFSPKTGPALTARWPQATFVGEPFAAHAHVDAAGTILFVASHDPHGPTAWMSALDGETGKILWQTQLGSTPRSDPVVLGDSIVWDDGHGICRARVPQADACGVDATYHPGAALPASTLLVGEPCVRVAWSAVAPKLTYAEVDAETVGPSREVALPAAVAGAPIVQNGSLIVPLASGVLVRVDRAAGSVVSGPDWRVPGGSGDAALLAVGPDRFLTTNGKGGVTLFEWSKTWKELARNHDGRAFTGPPVAITAGIVIAASDTLVLLDPVTLRVVKSWKLDGRATSAPQAFASGVAIVVDQKRLVTIDPTKDGVSGDRDFLADIVALAAVKDGLIVADSNGNLWPPQGEARLSLTANLVAAARPLPLADGRLFVLWCDGTAGVVGLPK